MESRMVPETVQLMVEVAGLKSWAPALEMIRPAGTAPLRRAQRKRSYQCSRLAGSASTSDSARATRCQVASGVTSIGVPSLCLSRYLLSQMSSDAACKAMPWLPWTCLGAPVLAILCPPSMKSPD
ncbi:hypothetical protein D9M68_656850 [compost metagenome]